MTLASLSRNFSCVLGAYVFGAGFWDLELCLPGRRLCRAHRAPRMVKSPFWGRHAPSRVMSCRRNRAGIDMFLRPTDAAQHEECYPNGGAMQGIVLICRMPRSGFPGNRSGKCL